MNQPHGAKQQFKKIRKLRYGRKPTEPMMAGKTHVNPCFWSALWNEEYHQGILEKGTSSLRASQQIVKLE